MDRERVAPPAFDRDGSPKERADLGGQDIESAAHQREAGEAGLEHRTLTLELTATVHQEADERALQAARIGARQAERRDAEVGRRRAQLVQRRVGGGRIGLRALLARAARRDQQDAGDARPREVRRQLAALGGSGRDHVEGGGRDDDHVARFEDVEGRHARPEHAHPGDGCREPLHGRLADRDRVGQEGVPQLADGRHRDGA